MTGLSISLDTPTTPEMVRWAFLTILGHGDIADAVIQSHQALFPRFGDLCEALKYSQEFALTYGPRMAHVVDVEEAHLTTVVASLYRAFLRRVPDAAGMADNVALLRQLGGLSGVGQLASIFEQSTERAIRDQLATCMRWITSNNGQADEFEGRLVISLGSHCAPAMILKKNELKQFSTPFDWIFSTPAMVRHCIEDRFRTFLNPIYHRSATRINQQGRVENIAEHIYYSENYFIDDLVFNHRDITKPQVLKYYQRCAHRFMQLLQNAQPVYFLQCVLAESYEGDQCLDEFRATAELLSKEAPHASLAMFAIRFKGGIMPDVRVLEDLGRHRLFLLETVSILGALDFHEQIDQIGLMRALRWHARTPGADAGQPFWEAQHS